MSVAAQVEPKASERACGSAARLTTYARDHKRSYEAIGASLRPSVDKRLVKRWARQEEAPTPAYRTQLADLTHGFVAEDGWAPSRGEVTAARARLQVVADADAARTLARLGEVRRRVVAVPKASRQRWTRWQQLRLL